LVKIFIDLIKIVYDFCPQSGIDVFTPCPLDVSDGSLQFEIIVFVCVKKLTPILP